MSQLDSSAAASLWRRRAKVLALKLNFHHWLAQVIPILFAGFVLLALFEVFRRETGLPARWMESLILLSCAMAAGAAWLRARRHFCTWQKSLVRLETVLHLHNRLSAAQDGVVPWPSPSGKIEDGYVENWKLVLMPLLAGSIFLAAAHLVPVSRMNLGEASVPISEPPAFAQVQSWINALKAEDLIEPDKLQETQTALDKLRQRPAQDWYTQSNLEAADSLKELTEQSMNTLAQNLDQADSAVQAMQKKMESTSDATSLQPMEDALHSAGENLVSGNLPLKHEVVSPMLGGENSTDKPLSAAQLEALHERLKKGKLAAQTAPKSNGGLSDEMEQAMADAASGHGLGRRHLVPGSGGLGGGTETAPLELEQRDKTTPPGALTAVSNDDMSRASLGDTIKVSAGKHTIDQADYRGTQGGGSAQVQGSGGEAVWRSTYDPQEADALSRFFK
jgi:hypothetical protein